MSWNYRIGTTFLKYPKHMWKILIRKGDRVFSVIECHYNKKGKPNAYGEPFVLANYDDIKDLKLSHKLIAGAFKKPILDLDNFPKEYKLKKEKKKNNI